MFGDFTRSNEDHRNVPAVTPFKNTIFVDIYFSQDSVEFAQEWQDGRLSFLAKMAVGPRVESYLARARGGQARVLRMLLHGFGLEYFWNGPAYG